MFFLDLALSSTHYSTEIPESGKPLQSGGILLMLKARV